MKEEEKFIEARKFDFLKEKLHDLPKKLKKYCNNNIFNVFLYQHLGDNFYRLYFLREFEKKHGPVNILLNRRDAQIADLLGIKNYTVVEIELWIDSILAKHIKDRVIFEYAKHYLIEQVLPGNPEKGNVFIIKPNSNLTIYENIFGKIDTQSKYTCACLGIFENIKIDPSTINFNAAQNNESSNNKTALLLPEANSDLLLNHKVWNNVSFILRKNGYSVFENIVNKNTNHINGATSLNLSIRETLDFACASDMVISLRSGICDLLACTSTKLIILQRKERFNDIKHWFGFNENINLSPNHLPVEFVLGNCLSYFLFNINFLRQILKT